MEKPTNYSVYAGKELSLWQDVAESPLNIDEASFLERWLPQDKNLHILEGGTGSGRISFNLNEQGYTHIAAFDFVPDMITTARSVAASRQSQIQFHVGDASCADDWLPYARHSFDYALYMQQLLSLISLEDWPQTLGAVRNLLKPGGYFLCTFVHDAGRKRNRVLRPVMRLIRWSRGQNEHTHRLPWLKLGNQPNLQFWQQAQALVNWLPAADILRRLEDSGLTIVDVTTSAQLQGKSGDRGYLYVVCQN